MKHPKLASFTVVEVAVALLLMAIVVALAYSVLIRSHKQLGSFEQHFTTDNSYRLLHHALQHDMHVAQTAQQAAGTLLLQLADQSTVHYTFSDSLVIREMPEIAVDSFRFQVDSIYFGFEAKPQIKDGGLVDEVRLYLQQDRLPYVLHQEKMYDAATLIRFFKRIKTGTY